MGSSRNENVLRMRNDKLDGEPVAIGRTIFLGVSALTNKHTETVSVLTANAAAD